MEKGECRLESGIREIRIETREVDPPHQGLVNDGPVGQGNDGEIVREKEPESALDFLARQEEEAFEFVPLDIRRARHEDLGHDRGAAPGIVSEDAVPDGDFAPPDHLHSGELERFVDRPPADPAPSLVPRQEDHPRSVESRFGEAAPALAEVVRE